MKKALLVLTFLMLFLMTMSAQIKRTIMGQTLGVSTKEEVYNSLKSKGAFLQTVGGEELVFLSDVRFGGVPWDNMSFAFYNNLLCSVSVVDLSSTGVSGMTREKWKAVSEKLESKYHDYPCVKKDEGVFYEDDATSVVMVFIKGSLMLMYSDVKLRKEKSAKEDEEF